MCICYLSNTSLQLCFSIGYQLSRQASVSFESMILLCNSCQPMHFFSYASTISWLVDLVVTLLISATADTILLFYPTSAAHSRCIGDAHTILEFLLSADLSRFWLFSISIKYGRSILSFPILIHTLLSADLSAERLATYISISHIPLTTLQSAT
jgi:hypothetical protein